MTSKVSTQSAEKSTCRLWPLSDADSVALAIAVAFVLGFIVGRL